MHEAGKGQRRPRRTGATAPPINAVKSCRPNTSAAQAPAAAAPAISSRSAARRSAHRRTGKGHDRTPAHRAIYRPADPRATAAACADRRPLQRWCGRAAGRLQQVRPFQTGAVSQLRAIPDTRRYSRQFTHPRLEPSGTTPQRASHRAGHPNPYRPVRPRPQRPGNRRPDCTSIWLPINNCWAN